MLFRSELLAGGGLRQMMDRLFDDSFMRSPLTAGWDEGTLAVDISEKDHQLVVRTSLLTDTPARYGIPPLVFLPVNIAVLVSIITRFAPDLSVTPPRQFEAMDHAIFVGVMTFSILGLVQQLVPVRLSGWHTQFMFWGMLVGVSLFVAGLLADMTPLLHAGTPLLGLAILAGVGVYAPKLLRGG